MEGYNLPTIIKVNPRGKEVERSPSGPSLLQYRKFTFIDDSPEGSDSEVGNPGKKRMSIAQYQERMSGLGESAGGTSVVGKVRRNVALRGSTPSALKKLTTLSCRYCTTPSVSSLPTRRLKIATSRASNCTGAPQGLTVTGLRIYCGRHSRARRSHRRQPCGRKPRIAGGSTTCRAVSSPLSAKKTSPVCRIRSSALHTSAVRAIRLG